MEARQRGFTLLELMVVVLILGMLVAIVVPNVRRHIEKARISTAKTDMATMGNAVQVFEMENKKLPISLEALTEPDPMLGEALLAYIPSDPWDQPYEYRRLSRRKYEILCSGPDGESGTQDDLRHPIVLRE